MGNMATEGIMACIQESTQKSLAEAGYELNFHTNDPAHAQIAVPAHKGYAYAVIGSVGFLTDRMVIILSRWMIKDVSGCCAYNDVKCYGFAEYDYSDPEFWENVVRGVDRYYKTVTAEGNA